VRENGKYYAILHYVVFGNKKEEEVLLESDNDDNAYEEALQMGKALTRKWPWHIRLDAVDVEKKVVTHTRELFK
jgi:hypothetical protein